LEQFTLQLVTAKPTFFYELDASLTNFKI